MSQKPWAEEPLSQGQHLPHPWAVGGLLPLLCSRRSPPSLLPTPQRPAEACLQLLGGPRTGAPEVSAGRTWLFPRPSLASSPRTSGQGCRGSPVPAPSVHPWDSTSRARPGVPILSQTQVLRPGLVPQAPLPCLSVSGFTLFIRGLPHAQGCSAGTLARRGQFSGIW